MQLSEFDFLRCQTLRPKIQSSDLLTMPPYGNILMCCLYLSPFLAFCKDFLLKVKFLAEDMIVVLKFKNRKEKWQSGVKKKVALLCVFYLALGSSFCI